jgi:hypothetical protein
MDSIKNKNLLALFVSTVLEDGAATAEFPNNENMVEAIASYLNLDKCDVAFIPVGKDFGLFVKEIVDENDPINIKLSILSGQNIHGHGILIGYTPKEEGGVKITDLPREMYEHLCVY